jgi:hypothetical protein
VNRPAVALTFAEFPSCSFCSFFFWFGSDHLLLSSSYIDVI